MIFRRQSGEHLKIIGQTDDRHVRPQTGQKAVVTAFSVAQTISENIESHAGDDDQINVGGPAALAAGRVGFKYAHRGLEQVVLRFHIVG